MKSNLFSMALAVAAMLAAASVSRAGSITYITPSGSTAGGQSVDVTTTLTTSAGHVLITMQNLENNPKSDIQTLNGISFTLSTGQTAVSSFTQEAVQRTVTSNAAGGFTDTGTPTTPIVAPDKWHFNAAGLGIEITSIGNSAGHGTLIGGPDGSNAYAVANSSITNANHNPFMAGIATFDLSITGVTAASTITALRFEFGTEAGTNVTGQSVPEPSSLVMAGLGSLGLLAVLVRRRLRETAGSNRFANTSPA
jgi:hypothetical protein